MNFGRLRKSQRDFMFMQAIYECINEAYGWSGKKINCLTFKHDQEYLLCPECHEHVEESTSHAKSRRESEASTTTNSQG